MLYLPITSEIPGKGPSRGSFLGDGERDAPYPTIPGLPKRVLAAGRILAFPCCRQGRSFVRGGHARNARDKSIAEMGKRGRQGESAPNAAPSQAQSFRGRYGTGGARCPVAIQAIKSDISEKVKGTIPAFDRLCTPRNH